MRVTPDPLVLQLLHIPPVAGRTAGRPATLPPPAATVPRNVQHRGQHIIYIVA